MTPPSRVAAEDWDRKDCGMSPILLVVHPERPAAWELARTATRWWQHQGRDVVEIRGNGPEASFAESDDVEFAVSLGGDGTMLRTV